jgi:hypothetical protein
MIVVIARLHNDIAVNVLCNHLQVKSLSPTSHPSNSIVPWQPKCHVHTMAHQFAQTSCIHN